MLFRSELDLAAEAPRQQRAQALLLGRGHGHGGDDLGDDPLLHGGGELGDTAQVGGHTTQVVVAHAPGEQEKMTARRKLYYENLVTQKRMAIFSPV